MAPNTVEALTTRVTVGVETLAPEAAFTPLLSRTIVGFWGQNAAQFWNEGKKTDTRLKVPALGNIAQMSVPVAVFRRLDMAISSMFAASILLPATPTSNSTNQLGLGMTLVHRSSLVVSFLLMGNKQPLHCLWPTCLWPKLPMLTHAM